MGTALGEALLKVLAGVVVLVALLGAVIVPLAIGHVFLGPNWGATVGCGGVVLLLLGIGLLLDRYPVVPGAAIIEMICSYCIALMIMVAPIGGAIELIDDRTTATWTGMALGVGIVVAGSVVLHRWDRARRPRQGPQDRAVASTATGKSGSTTRTEHDDGPGR